jgi:hypothetical protein
MCLSSAWAQIDLVDRQMFPMGYNQPLQGRGPMAGYAFNYLNKPIAFNRANLTFRLAAAPVFLDSQPGIKDVLGPDTDLAVGLEGGGFADNFAEMQRGRFVRGESFVGHGGGTSLSLFHRVNPDSRIPLNALLNGFYSIPLDHDKNWFLAFMVGSAAVDYLPGLQQSGDWHTGVGGGIRYRSPNRAWQIALGYGFNAIRKSVCGAHSIGILLQYDFDLGQPLFDPGLPPSQWRGFDRLFGR